MGRASLISRGPRRFGGYIGCGFRAYQVGENRQTQRPIDRWWTSALAGPIAGSEASPAGLQIFDPGYLDRDGQMRISRHVRTRSRTEAPFFTPVMPRSGRPFTVRMTNLGPLGWVSDRAGYRYQATHPETGEPWPPIPPDGDRRSGAMVADYPHEPEACLVNHYREGAKMGLHRDEDEEDFAAPVVSISLGDTAIFRSAAPSAAARPRRSSSPPATCW